MYKVIINNENHSLSAYIYCITDNYLVTISYVGITDRLNQPDGDRLEDLVSWLNRLLQHAPS